MDPATVTLLRMEAMGIEGLSQAAHTGRVRARSMDRQQERAWPMANLANPALSVAMPTSFYSALGLPQLAAAKA